jgi:hypothetical protein
VQHFTESTPRNAVTAVAEAAWTRLPQRQAVGVRATHRARARKKSLVKYCGSAKIDARI